jgi:Caspase domain
VKCISAISHIAPIVTASVFLFAVSTASAEKRVALVIGNGAYQRVDKLPNPTNDAKIISGMLQAAKFDAVDLYENLGIREMRQAINDFADTARDAETAVVYFSGHGMEVNGINYLLPVDAVLARDTDVPYESVSLDNLVQVMEPARRLRLVMLDACRNNPFVRSMRRTVGTRAIGRGLAAVEPTSVNTLIGYAAKAGSYALDGEGANSPYAMAVLNNLAKPCLDLRLTFGRVRDEVLKSTNNRQEPFIYGSLGGVTVSIVDAPEGASPITSLPPQAPLPSRLEVAQFCQSVSTNTSIAVVQALAEQYRGTPMGACAGARIEELRKNQVTVIPAPVVVPQPQSPPPQSALMSSVVGGRWAVDGSKNCSVPSKTYTFEVRSDDVIWRDGTGNVYTETITANEVSAFRTKTRNSPYHAVGTPWLYGNPTRNTVTNRVDSFWVTQGGGNRFFVERCP